jgi:hypothetical protein
METKQKRITQKEVVRTVIEARGRGDLIAKLRDWANKLPYDNHIHMSIVAIVSDMPYWAPDKSEKENNQ